MRWVLTTILGITLVAASTSPAIAQDDNAERVYKAAGALATKPVATSLTVRRNSKLQTCDCLRAEGLFRWR